MTVSINHVGAAPPLRHDAVCSNYIGGNMKNTLHRVMMALVGLAPLTGCGSPQQAAEAAVRQNMKDPDSARFGSFYFNKQTNRGCLTVNGRNSMGGYTGNQQAFVEKSKDGWMSLMIEDVSADLCRRAHADRVSSSIEDNK